MLIIHLLIIAAYGLRALWERAARKKTRGDMLIAAICAALLVAIFLPYVHRVHGTSEKMSGFFRAYAIALGASLLALPWIVRGIRRHPNAGHFIAGGLCLFVIHFRHGLWTDTKFDSSVANPRAHTNLAALSPSVSLIRTSFEGSGRPARVTGLGSVLAPGFNAVLGLEHFSGADALVNRWQHELFGTGIRARDCRPRRFLARESFPHTRCFGDLWNTRFYLGDPADLPRDVRGLELVKTLDLDIYVSPRARPRAFFTDRLAECSSLENFTDLLCTGDGRPFAAIVPDETSVTEPAKLAACSEIPSSPATGA